MGSIDDRRSYQRHDVPGAIRWAFFNTSGYRQAEMVDYGKGGLSFQTRVSIKPGANLTIKGEGKEPVFYRPEAWEGFPTVKVAEVKWCLPEGDSKTDPRYKVGVRYHPGYYDG